MLKIIASVQKGETESPNLKYVNQIFIHLLLVIKLEAPLPLLIRYGLNLVG